jgi:hypothetical protein
VQTQLVRTPLGFLGSQVISVTVKHYKNYFG